MYSCNINLKLRNVLLRLKLDTSIVTISAFPSILKSFREIVGNLLRSWNRHHIRWTFINRANRNCVVNMMASRVKFHTNRILFTFLCFTSLSSLFNSKHMPKRQLAKRAVTGWMLKNSSHFCFKILFGCRLWETASLKWNDVFIKQYISLRCLSIR